VGKKYSKKINIKIRNYFKGLPFEEGIMTLEDEKLIELLFLFDLPSGELHREEMIRSLRRAWSESNLEVRSQIVSFLTQHSKKGKKQKEDSIATLLSLMEGIDRTPYEENILLETFLEANLSKVTPKKIVAKLNYIRMQERIEQIEEALDVEFNPLNEMEFLHSYLFQLETVDFYKRLLTHTDSIESKELVEREPHEAIAFLDTLKERAIEEKKKSIEHFITAYLPAEHRYLDEKMILEALKTMPIESELLHIPIPFETVESIIRKISNKYEICETVEHVIIEKSKEFELYGEMLYYNVSVSYKKEYLYSLIWRGSELPVKEELNRANENLVTHFMSTIENLYQELEQLAEKLFLEPEAYCHAILQFVTPSVDASGTLKLKDKVKRRIIFHFSEMIKPLLAKQKREELLANTIRDFKKLFPLARSLKRKIIFHVGETNSGKTYAALQSLKGATTGYYLAPLRLLALEGYESLKSMGVQTSLITGEEEIIDEDSTHISSTIEMMNSSVDVDVCVIDEIQMIVDRDRGWAWANALIGVPAKTVIITGSLDALKAVEALCTYLEEPLEVVEFKRKNELALLKHPIPLNQIEPKTAVVTFSRREVLSLKQQLAHYHSVSVVYGNLSPEVRREEARRFREGESDVLIATDAIAMGLNLPIKTLLFAKDNKFDGLRRRELTPTEVQQISGRAGRYGIEEKGFVGALDEHTLETIHSRFHASLPQIELPVSVMASLEHVLLIGEILETERISDILTFFSDNMEFDGPFVAANIDSMIEIASIVDGYTLDTKARFYLSCAPASISSPYIESVFHRYIRQIESDAPVAYIPPKDLPAFAQTNDMLLNAEDRVREISLYLWLSFKFPHLFLDTAQAIAARTRLNQFIEHSLRQGHFTKNCRRCNKVLDFSYRFSICDTCYNASKRGRKTQKGFLGNKKKR
jgi:ATP-dependent RNA helicase SUPV3L1/SUV3